MKNFMIAYMRARDWLYERCPEARRMPAYHTQSTLAAVIGVHHSTMSRYLRGVRKPDWAAVIALHAVADGFMTEEDLLMMVQYPESRWILRLKGGQRPDFRPLKVLPAGGK